jgi:hypothetical protein
VLAVAVLAVGWGREAERQRWTDRGREASAADFRPRLDLVLSCCASLAGTKLAGPTFLFQRNRLMTRETYYSHFFSDGYR